MKAASATTTAMSHGLALGFHLVSEPPAIGRGPLLGKMDAVPRASTAVDLGRSMAGRNTNVRRHSAADQTLHLPTVPLALASWKCVRPHDLFTNEQLKRAHLA
jgi:hypothetical protein